MNEFKFNQEACNACKTFAETTSAVLDEWCSSCASGDVDTVQENNPPPPTIGKVLAQPGVD